MTRKMGSSRASSSGGVGTRASVQPAPRRLRGVGEAARRDSRRGGVGVGTLRRGLGPASRREPAESRVPPRRGGREPGARSARARGRARLGGATSRSIGVGASKRTHASSRRPMTQRGPFLRRCPWGHAGRTSGTGKAREARLGTGANASKHGAGHRRRSRRRAAVTRGGASAVSRCSRRGARSRAW